MSKFKIGDRVKFVTDGNYLNVPTIGTITNYQRKDGLHNEGYFISHREFDYFMYPHEIELIEEFTYDELLKEPLPFKEIEAKKVYKQNPGGSKNDSQKPDLSLIPTDALLGMGQALTYGANKYARHNYRDGINYSRLVAATMRHLSAWNEGENNDSESGLSHLDHAMASLAMLKFMDVNKPENDDRFKLEKKQINENEIYEAALEAQKRGR